MSAALKGISSMATRLILAELVEAWRTKTGGSVEMDSVGGVDAAKRVRAGEGFDVVALAQDALEKLEAEGHLVAGSIAGFARSSLAAAVRAGAPKPDFSDAAAVRAALGRAATIGYSTGPSGTHLMNLLAQWGIAEAVADKLRQAPPGVPVATMVARGDAEIGFQQLSELLGIAGIDILDALPPGVAFETVFASAVATRSSDPTTARAFVAHLAGAETAAIKRRHGMEPV